MTRTQSIRLIGYLLHTVFTVSTHGYHRVNTRLIPCDTSFLIYPACYLLQTVLTVSTHSNCRMTKTFNLYDLQVIDYIRYLPCQHTINTVWQELLIYPTYKLFTTYGIRRVSPCQHTVNTVWQELLIYLTYKIFTTYCIYRVNIWFIPCDKNFQSIQHKLFVTYSIYRVNRRGIPCQHTVNTVWQQL